METIQSRAPIIFFAYKRPEHVRRSLESIERCEGAAESELFIYSDGPRGIEDEEGVEEVRKIIKSRQWCKETHVIEREKNMGLSNSIIEGVTEIISRYERAIIIEDDLVLSSQFLNFMNKGLEIYKDVPRVMEIAGYSLPVKNKLPDTYFFRATSSWGWATWKRAWHKFEPDVEKLLPRFESKKIQWEYDVKGSEDFFYILKNDAIGVVDSWDARWHASVFLNEGLCLYPGKSLVKNIGHDGSGEHCGQTTSYDVNLSDNEDISFEHEIREKGDTIKAMINFYLSQKSLSRRIKRIIWSFFI